MQEALLGPSHPEFTGHWRDRQVWIGGSNFGPHDAAFVPPHQERVPEAMDDLVRFLAREDIPSLIHAAAAHAQFETVHPFPDGNGRTGRALIHALLRARGVTTNVTIPVSAGLLTDTAGYFDALTRFREGDLDPIVTAVADAAFAAVHNGGILVADLQRIQDEWSERITARRGSAARRLADHLIGQPAVSGRTLEHELSVAPATAYSAIDHLVDVGILKETTNKGWARIWVANDVLEALDDFAARAGRRSST
jgi:Fic family protein